MHAPMKFRSVQVLRAVAVLLVVAYHGASLRLLTAGSDPAGNLLLNGIFDNGYAGVDLFFVISGFIMVTVSRPGPRGPAAAAEFLFARALRIYPLWWAAAACATAYYAILHVPAPDDPAWRLALREAQASGFLARSFLLIPQPDFPVLSVGWTLIHEMYFYLVFALLLVLPRAVLPFGLLAWGGLVLAGAALGLARPEATGFVSLAVHPLTLEFLFGAGAAFLLARRDAWRPGLVSLAGAVWFAVMLGLQGEVTAFTLQWGRVLAFGLPAALLVYGLAGLEQSGRTGLILAPVAGGIMCAAAWQFQGLIDEAPGLMSLSGAAFAGAAGLAAGGLVLARARAPAVSDRTLPVGRVLMQAFVRIGDWSYVIYLGHIFVIAACLSGLALLGPVLPEGRPQEAVYIAAICIGTLLCGWLGHSLVERPLLAMARSGRKRLFRGAASAPPG